MESWKSWSICFHLCLYILYLTLSCFVLCSSVAGAKGPQSPPLSAFSSFPTSLSRPQEHRCFCSKWSVRAGPTALLVDLQWHSKTCSMRCSKLQVNNTLLDLPHIFVEFKCTSMWIVFLYFVCVCVCLKDSFPPTPCCLLCIGFLSNR